LFHEELCLNGAWDLRDEILTFPASDAAALAEQPDGWISTPVPGDIHQGLVESGRIHEPLVGLNSFDCVWTEQRSWWFRRRFSVPQEWLQAELVELELNGLDSNAELFLNGRHIGSHRNTFRPFVRDVRPCLVAGENTLLVRLTAGVEDVSEAQTYACDGVQASTEAGNGRPERGDPRRIFVRKPQYSFGWDWSPRLATTAIAGDVILRAMSGATIRDVALRPVKHGEQVIVTATVLVDQFHYYKTREGSVSIRLTDVEGRSYAAESRALLRSGHTHVELLLRISDPLLWWPNGLGEPHRYRVEAELWVDGAAYAYPAFDYGIRFIELDTDGVFAFVVNGQRVYAKGADWIPADALYARVTAEKYQRLVREARDANFNMLRVWGGGLYEPEAFYEACDRDGIMLWHDFMFGCAPYPDHLEEFRREVELEADYQTRRLRRHACMALWCGNNENTWGFRDWWHEQTDGGAYLYNYLLPDLVHLNAPEIPYWNSSPYGGEEPNASEVGDRHHWGDCMMNPDMAKRIAPEEYDQCTSLFVSEFGYIGAPVKETVLTYLDGAPFDRQGRVWQHHNNTFEKNTVDAGIRKHYADPDSLSPDDYLLYTGLVQGLMYGYALESMRGRASCYGGLFWMYTDCWGEVGWTIVDYYLRRKPAWYYIRRTFAPLRLILRPVEGDQVSVVLANDMREVAHLALEYGYVSLDGTSSDVHQLELSAPGLSRTSLVTFGRGTHDPTRGLWMARAATGLKLQTATLRAVDYRALAVPECCLEVALLRSSERSCTLRISAPVYAHAVHFSLPSGALPSDAYFDLLPGEAREVVISSPQRLDPAEIVVGCVNGRLISLIPR